MKEFYNQHNQQKGLSLLELMFSVLIGMIALLGVLRLTSFAALDRERVSKEVLHRESLVIANNRLANILKQMYTMPCGDLDEMMAGNGVALARNKAGSPALIDGLISKMSTDAGSQHIVKEFFPLEVGVVPASKKLTVSGRPVNITDIVPGSDYFVITEIGEKLALSMGGKSVDSGAITLSSLPGLTSTTTEKKVFMISDCVKASIFRSIGGEAGNASSSAVITIPTDYILNAKFNESNSIVSQVRKYIVYVAKDGLRKKNLLTGATEQVADDIKNMKIRWGVGEDNKLSTYLSSEALNASPNIINKIVTAEITITMPSTIEGETRDYIQLIALRNKIKR